MTAKGAPLTAVRLASAEPVTLPDGRVLEARPGDWLIARGRTPIDVVGERGLADRYSLVEGGTLLLSAGDCARLDATLGVGATRSATDLVAAVERLATIKIGNVRIDFTPGQLEEIVLRAKKRGQTVQQALQATIDRIKDELFWRS